jgi:hypothetical protein
VTGSKNKVTWKSAKTGDAPAVSNIGKDNMIAQAGGAAPGITASATPTAPAPTAGSVIDCAKTPSFMYAENEGTFTFTGKCETIAISGNDNQLKIESVKTLLLSGNENTAHTAAAGTINTSGNSNTVTYKGALAPATKTRISNTGNRNKISTVK